MKKKKKEKSFPGDRSQCLSQGWRISVPEQLVMMVTMLQWWQQKHTALFYVPEPISAWHVLAHLILSTTLGDGTVVLLTHSHLWKQAQSAFLACLRPRSWLVVELGCRCWGSGSQCQLFALLFFSVACLSVSISYMYSHNFCSILLFYFLPSLFFI